MNAEIEKRNYDKILFEAELAGQIATMHPILAEFVDEELEDRLQCEYFSRYGQINFEPQRKNILFYNSQIVNRGALTQQYLSYFIDNGYNVLVVVPFRKNTLLGDEILNKIQSAKNAELFIPVGNDYKARVESLVSKIKKFRPENTFIHLIPYDVLGYSVFSNLKSSISYYIVHNDHTFWLGKKCADYFIEFRNFGKAISIQRRKIEPSKILCNPYYPIIDGNKFLGFPFNNKGKVIGLLASNPYKVMMDGNQTLLNVLKEALVENENLIIIVAGKFSNKLRSYIAKNKLDDRLIPIGQRSDFGALMKNVDIYINSYPLIGGLTTQYAAVMGIPIVTYTKEELKSTNLAEDLLRVCKIPITFTNIADFKNRLIDLIQNPELRSEFKDESKISAYSKNDFDEKMKRILFSPKSNTINVKSPSIEHDDDTFLHYYLQRNHDLDKLRKSSSQQYRIEKFFGETPHLAKFRIKKFAKKVLRINR